MKTELIEKAYAIARERYAEIGVDTEKALAALQNISLSLHCWQADDVTGFENRGGDLTGGIQATGNYPGKARNIEELRADILKAKSFIPGTHRLNLHEIYGEFGGETVDRDQVEPRHFQGWIEWAKEHGMKLDFNSTSFSHPKSGDLSLANPDPGIRDFWVEHTKRCRAIAEEMGKAQGDPSIMNLWVHDGSKDLTVNRMLYRELLRDSLDRIFETEYDHMKDCIESKVFGIGLESYTVGSNDFYIGYGASRGKIVTLDTGHFHPTEIVADKISSLLLFIPGVVKAYSYAMTPYIMAEHPGLTTNEAITESRRIMDGNKWRLFCLDLSFLGWELLCTLPMLIGFSLVFAFTHSADTVLVLPILLSIPLSAGFFFLHPYEEAAWAIFYRDITAAPSDTEEI